LSRKRTANIELFILIEKHLAFFSEKNFFDNKYSFGIISH